MTTTHSVRFPLKLKLLAVMLVLISASLSVFVGIALKTFKEDKAAYIFETLLSKATSGEIILTQQLPSSGQSFQIAQGKLTMGDAVAENLLSQVMEKDSSYIHKIVVPKDNNFFEWQNGKVTEVNPELKKIYAPMIKDSVHQAVKEVQLNGEQWIYAYHYNPVRNYAFVVTLPQKEAFAVTTYLINKSLYYGLFILGIALVLSVLLARPLTSSLETVYGLTQEIAAGNFSQRIQVNSSDEVGALGNSVNYMADKIVVYMQEMKEKARLENEVNVAQLVQSSFFPPSDLKDSSVEIHGHFEPATECGGDWWGVFEREDWKVLFIADATGHGVPAALLTATMNCCKSSLDFILETRPQMISQPHEILRYMNQAVCGSGKEIQVTCFVATFNKKTLQLHYANASHTPPLLFNGHKSELKKEDFQPLIEANGPRLGQKLDSSYDSQIVELKSHDTLILYTDGLTEAENADGQRWGERRLIKTLSQNSSGSPEQVIRTLLQEMKAFSPHRPGDDITVVAMKVLT